MTKPDPSEEEMTFWEHLDELRSTLIWSIGGIVVCGILAFVFKDILFDHILLAPKEKSFITYRLLCQFGEFISFPSLCIDPSYFEIININLAGQFMSHMVISLVAGLILAMPFVVWQFWRFIKPGLTDNEIRHTRGAVFVISSLFLTGVLFSYFIVVPLMGAFFIDILNALVIQGYLALPIVSG